MEAVQRLSESKTSPKDAEKSLGQNIRQEVQTNKYKEESRAKNRKQVQTKNTERGTE